jgi:tRNA U34 5-carboxymethylaminomethyl modifying GTPase MnmE/TrmE
MILRTTESLGDVALLRLSGTQAKSVVKALSEELPAKRAHKNAAVRAKDQVVAVTVA